MWWGVAIIGLLDYAHVVPLPGAVADSVPVLYFMSAIALATGDRGTAQGYRVEEKQEAAEASAHDAD